MSDTYRRSRRTSVKETRDGHTLRGCGSNSCGYCISNRTHQVNKARAAAELKLKEHAQHV